MPRDVRIVEGSTVHIRFPPIVNVTGRLERAQRQADGSILLTVGISTKTATLTLDASSARRLADALEFVLEDAR